MRSIWWLMTLTACGFVPKGADSAADTAATTTRDEITTTSETTPTATATGPDTTNDTGIVTTGVDSGIPTTTPTPACVDPLAGMTGLAGVRVVNLMLDPPIIDLSLNGAPTALIEDMPLGNTDFTGAYAPFPPSTYSVQITDDGAPVSDLSNIGVVADAEYSWFLYGGSGAATAIATLVDDPCVRPTTHELRVFHYAISMPPTDVWLKEPLQASVLASSGLAYTGNTGFLRTAAGLVDLEIDTNGDGLADTDYELDLAAGDWSHVYVLSSAGSVLVLHHVLGSPLKAVPGS